jgi:hypothetical protein
MMRSLGCDICGCRQRVRLHLAAFLPGGGAVITAGGSAAIMRSRPRKGRGWKVIVDAVGGEWWIREGETRCPDCQ